jgi:hypothetical protein
MRNLVRIGAIAGLMLGATAGVASTAAAEGEGHTPVVVCHWVPADDGSFVRIVIDDDAAFGNANDAGHDAHENDIYRNPGQLCPDLD